MKTFRDYLVETAKTFDYRIKIVGDLPAGFEKEFKDALKQFDPVSTGSFKTTPILAKPQGFANFPNSPVNIMDVEFRYPAAPPQITKIARLLGIDSDDRVMTFDRAWSDGMDKELLGIEDQNKDLLNSPYPADSAEQRALKADYAAVGVDKQVVKNSAGEARFTVAGGRTPPAETTNELPMGIKSPISNIKRPPKPATGAQPRG